MQLGYSQFSHSQPYAHSPFQWPTIPTLWQTKPNKQTKNNQKTRNRSSFQHSDNIFNKNNSFRMWQRQTFLQMEIFFLLFFLFLEKSTKNWIFRKKSVAFFFFFSVTWELKWTGRGEKGGTTLQPIKKSPNPFCPPPRNYYHFLPSQPGKRSLPNTSQKYIQVFSE